MSSYKIMCAFFLTTIALDSLGEEYSEVRSNRDMPTPEITVDGKGMWDVGPQLKSGKAPIYPISLRVSYKEGSALVRFCIDEAGKTFSFEVVEASHELFGRHAVIAMKNWIYEPAKKDGKPVSVCVQKPWAFRMKR